MNTLEGIGFYLLLCLISLLAGKGILRLLGVPLEINLSYYLAPITTLTFWTLLLGIGISLGFSIKQFWPIGWSLTALMVIKGLQRAKDHPRKTKKALLVFMILLPVGPMFFYFWNGLRIYLGSTLPDGWSYIAYGQYLWEFPRGTEGGLAPLYQYAAHLNGTRFIGSALLAFLSPAIGTPGDTQAASGFFLALTCFTFSSTCIFFVVVKGFKGAFLFLYAGLCVFSGWILNLLWTNNYDNALAIAFLPALAGVILLMDARNRRWGILVAAMAAAILYCYPEMALIILGGASFFAIQRFITDDNKMDWFILFLFVLFSALLLVAPFIKELTLFIHNQINISISNQGVRPGEGYFQELLKLEHAFPAFWGFRPGSTAGDILHLVLSLALSALAVIGICRLSRQKEWSMLLTLAALFCGAMIMIFHAKYSYGAYKLILLNWWGIAFVVIVGADWLGKRYQTGKIHKGIGLIFLIIFIVIAVRVGSSERDNSALSILPFKMVERIASLTGGEPIYTAIQDDLANEWAVYFLRRQPIYLAEYRVYMAQPHVVPLMRRSKDIDAKGIRFILTDEKKTEILRTGKPYYLLWTSGPYFLWNFVKPDGAPILTCRLDGFGNNDLMSLSESAGGDGERDARFVLEVMTSGTITGIEIRNIDGIRSIWDTTPGNGHLLLGVADPHDPPLLLNRPDGSIAIDIHKGKKIHLYLADNSSIKAAETRYQVSVSFLDGRFATALVKR